MFTWCGLVDSTANVEPKIKRRIRLARACYKWFKRNLHDMEAAPFTQRVRMIKDEIIETLLYGYVAWTLNHGYFAEHRPKLHNLLQRITGYQRRQRTRPPHTVRHGLEQGTTREHFDDNRQTTPLLFFGGGV